jgi:hypothetical protein
MHFANSLVTDSLAAVAYFTTIERTLVAAQLAIGIGAVILLRRLARRSPADRQTQIDYEEAA